MCNNNLSRVLSFAWKSHEKMNGLEFTYSGCFVKENMPRTAKHTQNLSLARYMREEIQTNVGTDLMTQQ